MKLETDMISNAKFERKETARCPTEGCDGIATLQRHDHADRIGSITVKNDQCQALVCSTCGDWSLYGLDAEWLELCAAAVVLSTGPFPAEPQAIKWGRKSMGLNKMMLAALLAESREDIDAMTARIDAWEKGEERIPRQAQLALAGYINGLLVGIVNPKAEAERFARGNDVPIPTEMRVPPMASSPEAALAITRASASPTPM